VERRGEEWSGVEWSGVEWRGVEWSGEERSGEVCVTWSFTVSTLNNNYPADQVKNNEIGGVCSTCGRQVHVARMGDRRAV